MDLDIRHLGDTIEQHGPLAIHRLNLDEHLALLYPHCIKCKQSTSQVGEHVSTTVVQPPGTVLSHLHYVVSTNILKMAQKYHLIVHIVESCTALVGISGHSLPPITVTQHKGKMYIKLAINMRLK